MSNNHFDIFTVLSFYLDIYRYIEHIKHNFQIDQNDCNSHRYSPFPTPVNHELTNTQVLFRFLPSTSPAQKSTFLQELKSLSKLACVKNQRLIVGGPSISEPKEVSEGFEFGLVSFHKDKAALEEYQGSAEHKRYDTPSFVEVIWVI